jgi:hypothetical protein
MKNTYQLYELFGAKFLKTIFTDVPVQFNDFLVTDGNLLQVKQIAHDLDEIGHSKVTKLFAINIKSEKNEEAQRG